MSEQFIANDHTYDNSESLISEIKTDGKVFVISDTHFFHKRLWEVLHKTEDGGRDPNNTETIISNWASMVSDDDTVLHLGDVALALPPEEVTSRIGWLPGKIWLIPGNHDRTTQKINLYKDMGWKIIEPFDVVIDDLLVHFSHEPIPPNEITKNMINVHGHIHQVKAYTNQYVNCSIEILGYSPVLLRPLIDKQIRLYKQEIAL